MSHFIVTYGCALLNILTLGQRGGKSAKASGNRLKLTPFITKFLTHALKSLGFSKNATVSAA